jgi:hypothetical protein
MGLVYNVRLAVNCDNISHDYVGSFVFSLLIPSPFYSGLFVD